MDDDSEDDLTQHTAFSGSAFTGLITTPTTTHKWIMDSGCSQSISANLDEFDEYHAWMSTDKPYGYGLSSGTPGSTLGWGYVVLTLNTGYKMRLRAYYNPKMLMSMMGTEQIEKELGLWWMAKDHSIRQLKDDVVVGYTQSEFGVPILRMKNLQYTTMAAVPISSNILH